MIRTRVGYAGGTSEDPTYHNIGDHSETIQIDFDPTQISYGELLEIFWTSHRPTAPAYSRQYMSLIFFHNEDQKRSAQETKERVAAELGEEIHTQINPYSRFYLAEDYHQKYRLQQDPALAQEFAAMYPDNAGLTDSTAAARVNGLVGGYGTLSDAKLELEKLTLSDEARAHLLETLARFDW